VIDKLAFLISHFGMLYIIYRLLKSSKEDEKNND